MWQRIAQEGGNLESGQGYTFSVENTSGEILFNFTSWHGTEV